MKLFTQSWSPSLLLLWSCLCIVPATVRSAEEAAPAPPTVVQEPAVLPTNITGEVRLSQEALEDLRREIESSATRNAQAITTALSALEPALDRMRQRDMEAIEKSNRTILIAVGILGAVGLVVVLAVVLALVRAVGRISEAVGMTVARGSHLALGPATTGLTQADFSLGATTEKTSARFLGAVEHLEARIRELEQSLQRLPASTEVPPAIASTASATPTNVRPLAASSLASANRSTSELDPASDLAMLLGKGQALLNLNEVQEALTCFDQALALAPNNPDALVKRGLALEKLQNWEMAAETYSQAIALDDTLTVAYLYKGGVCNRLQRYREALECYEEALKAEKRRRVS